MAEVDAGVAEALRGSESKVSRAVALDKDRRVGRTMPANVEASSICSRACSSVGSRKTRGRYSMTDLSAHVEKTSEMGLRPWSEVKRVSTRARARPGGRGRRQAHLVGRPVDRVLGPRHALVVRQRGVALERVVHRVEPAAHVDVARARRRVVRIDDAEQRLERARGNARLEPQRGDVDDGRARRLGARAGRRRDRDERAQRSSDGKALADRRVDVVEQVGILLDGEAVGERSWP